MTNFTIERLQSFILSRKVANSLKSFPTTLHATIFVLSYISYIHRKDIYCRNEFEFSENIGFSLLSSQNVF